jgi:hypothetical protein
MSSSSTDPIIDDLLSGSIAIRPSEYANMYLDDITEENKNAVGGPYLVFLAYYKNGLASLLEFENELALRLYLLERIVDDDVIKSSARADADLLDRQINARRNGPYYDIMNYGDVVEYVLEKWINVPIEDLINYVMNIRDVTGDDPEWMIKYIVRVSPYKVYNGRRS